MRRSAKSLNTIHEHLGWFESWNVVLWDYDSGVFRDVASCFLFASFHNEATEAAEVNIVTGSHSVFDNIHELFH